MYNKFIEFIITIMVIKIEVWIVALTIPSLFVIDRNGDGYLIVVLTMTKNDLETII